MKKTILLFVLFSNLYVNAQTNTFPTTGSVGIGTMTPANKLHVYITTNADGISLDGSSNPAIVFRNNGVIKSYMGQVTAGGNYFTNAQTNDIIIRSESNNILLGRGSGAATLAIVNDKAGINTTGPRSKLDVWGGDIYVTGDDLNGTALVTSHTGIAYFGNNSYSNGIAITSTGNIGIGTSAPGPYKMAVEGTLAARKIKVTQVNPWADYVFENNYPLPSLQEVEQFIRLNKHLPGVPSAKEVETTGLDLGDSQAVLLKKIEELTLYIIAQNKRMDEQDKKIKDLEKQLKK